MNDGKEAFQVTGDTDHFIFIDAMNFLGDKVVLDNEEYKKLRKKYRELAFSIAKYTEIEVLSEFRSTLMKAIENGTTMSKFQEDMNEFLSKKGYEGLLPYKANNIFRTNLQTAYHAGHYKAMMEVKQLRPYWQYLTVGDGHTRAEHQAMDGKVFPADDAIWNLWYPPNGFGCRCIVVSLTENQIKRKGLVIEKEIPKILDTETGELNSVLPDKKFRSNPAKSKFNPDMKGYPKSLRRAFEQATKNV